MRKGSIFKLAILVLAGLGGLLAVTTVAANEARDIMQQAIDRDDGESQFSRETIATCQYALKNNKIRCVEKPRIKIIESVRKDYGPKGKDVKSVIIILKPAADAGIGFLQFDYDDPDAETDQWMYLSALGKVKRIVSGNENEPKKGSLFGSEFGYEDMERKHIDNFVYTLLGEEKVKGQDCWKIESLPVPAYARKSNYSRSINWVGKQHFRFYKSEMYDRNGKLIKQLTFNDYEKINDVWIPRKLNINNVQDRRISTLKNQSTTLNISVDDKLFNQRTLTDGAFREKRLQQLRQTAK